VPSVSLWILYRKRSGSQGNGFIINGYLVAGRGRRGRGRGSRPIAGCHRAGEDDDKGEEDEDADQGSGDLVPGDPLAFGGGRAYVSNWLLVLVLLSAGLLRVQREGASSSTLSSGGG
jgi:hypothetical protein